MVVQPHRRSWRHSAAAVGITLAVVAGATPSGAAAAQASPSAVLHAVGLFDPASGSWYLRDMEGGTTRLAPFGRLGDVPLMGDWDGDGVDTPGLYRPVEGRLLIRNGPEPVSFVYPLAAGGLPVVADTDGDGRDTVSLARDGRLYIMDGLGRGPESLEGPDPLPINLPAGTNALVGGDFDGDGVDEVAAVHHGLVELVGPSSRVVLADVGRALPVAGDWDGDGLDTLGGYDAWRAQFQLYGGHGEPVSIPLYYGSTGMLPVAGAFEDLAGSDDAPPYRTGLPAMGLGEEGLQVLILQHELARLGLYRGAFDGVFSEATSHAVMAFHKVLGVERTWVWEDGDSRRMANFHLPPLPDRPHEPDRVEVDLGRQVLYLFRDGVVTAIVPISSGGGYKYYSDFREIEVWAITPRGDFTIYRHVVGWDYVMRTEEDSGRCTPGAGDYCVYSPWNFAPWAALHGYDPVPEYPVSHGCVRMTLWDSDALEDDFYVGMPFHVWDEYPADQG